MGSASSGHCFLTPPNNRSILVGVEELVAVTGQQVTRGCMSYACRLIVHPIEQFYTSHKLISTFVAFTCVYPGNVRERKDDHSELTDHIASGIHSALPGRRQIHLPFWREWKSRRLSSLFYLPSPGALWSEKATCLEECGFTAGNVQALHALCPHSPQTVPSSEHQS